MMKIHMELTDTHLLVIPYHHFNVCCSDKESPSCLIGLVIFMLAPLSPFLGSINQLIRLWEYHPLTPVNISSLTEISNFYSVVSFYWFFVPMYDYIFLFLTISNTFLGVKLFKFRTRHILLKYGSRHVTDHRGYFCLTALDSVQHDLSMSCWWISSPVVSWKIWRALYISPRLYHVFSERLILKMIFSLLSISSLLRPSEEFRYWISFLCSCFLSQTSSGFRVYESTIWYSQLELGSSNINSMCPGLRRCTKWMEKMFISVIFRSILYHTSPRTGILMFFLHLHSISDFRLC